MTMRISKDAAAESLAISLLVVAVVIAMSFPYSPDWPDAMKRLSHLSGLVQKTTIAAGVFGCVTLTLYSQGRTVAAEYMSAATYLALLHPVLLVALVVLEPQASPLRLPLVLAGVTSILSLSALLGVCTLEGSQKAQIQ